MAEVAAAMDGRQRRIGEHAAQGRPLWATQALGQVLDDPAKRAQWERRAGQLGAYREITGWDHPGEAIGPEPSRAIRRHGPSGTPRSRSWLAWRASTCAT